jgi:hypothetical protein
MISTRLIESIPSDPISMSVLSISPGYPVFSLTMANTASLMRALSAGGPAAAAAAGTRQGGSSRHRPTKFEHLGKRSDLAELFRLHDRSFGSFSDGRHDLNAFN